MTQAYQFGKIGPMRYALGPKVDRAIKRKNLKNRAALAWKVGISESYLSRIVARKQPPSLRVAARLEDALDIPAREFAAVA